MGDADSVFRIRPGGQAERVQGGFANPMALCEADDGAIWLATYGGMFRTVHGRFERAPQPAEHYSYFDCAVSRGWQLVVQLHAWRPAALRKRRLGP